MNDLSELYNAFIEHISMLKINNANKDVISSISNSMEIITQLKNENLNCDKKNEFFFIEKMDNIFLTIKEKKK